MGHYPPLDFYVIINKMKKAVIFGYLFLILILMEIVGCQSNQQPVEVLSVNMVGTPPGPGGEINPGGTHIIEITLKNMGQEPVIYLRATLEPSTRSTDTSGKITEEQYTFDADFDINLSNPLLPGESKIGTCDIPGYIAILNNIMYPLKLHITFENRTLDYTKQVELK